MPQDDSRADIRAARDDVAIVLLEMQPQIVASSRTLAATELRKAAKAVRRLADALKLPIFASVVPLRDQPPELIAELDGIQTWPRSVISPFADPAIRRALHGSGRRKLAIGGVSSEIAVLHTVLDARREGYDAHVLADLCGGLSARTETTAFDQMQRAGATLSNISSFFTGLESDMRSDTGQAVMGALAQFWSWDTSG